MPKLVEGYTVAQGALTVMVEDCADPKDETHKLAPFLRDLFEQEEIMILDEPSISGEELFAKINQAARMEYSVKFPKPEKLLLCYYRRLNDLTPDWVDHFFERAKLLQDRAAPAAVVHYPIFYYEADSPLGEETEEIAKQLMRLGNTKDLIERFVYILWKSGFDTLDGQERGIATLLHVRSRKQQPRSMQNFGYGLRSICYGDYYDQRANWCKKTIAQCDNWINQEGDPGLSGLFAAVKAVVDHAQVQLEEASRKFDSITCLFPAPVEDYRKLFMGLKYERSVSDLDPRLQAQKQSYLESFRKRIEEQANLKQVKEFIETKLHFPDLVNLDEELRGNAFTDNFLKNYTAQNMPDKDLISAILERVRELLQPFVDGRADLRARKMQDTRRAYREQALGGAYANRRQFADNILNDLMPPIIREFSPQIRDTTVLVSGETKNQIELGGLDVRGAYEAYYYPPIDPRENVVLRDCDFLMFTENEEETLRRLKRMFGE